MPFGTKDVSDEKGPTRTVDFDSVYALGEQRTLPEAHAAPVRATSY